MTRKEHARPGWERAVAAERQLRALERMVKTQTMFVRPTDTFCANCYWEVVLKPLVSPWVGYERGFPHEQATDPPYEIQYINLADLLAEPDEDPIPATTATEEWLRTSDAYDAVTDYLIAIACEAECGTDHGFHRA